MAKKKVATPHYHIWSLPKRIFPRTKGNQGRKYAQEVRRIYQGLTYTNSKLQASAQVCIFYIKSIGKAKGYAVRPQEVFSEIETFANNYENFCYRIFALREKLIHFINAVVPIGFPDNKVRIEVFLTHPLLKEIGILYLLEKFQTGSPKKPNVLGELIENRNSLTHRLYYYNNIDHYMRPMNLDPSKNGIDKAWFRQWVTQIDNHAEQAIKGMDILGDLNHELSKKLVFYKIPSMRPKKVRRKLREKLGTASKE